MRDRLEELRQSVKPRQAVSGGQYFEIDGEVYRRVHDRQQNFGGSVGVCLRAQRMRLGIAEGVLEAAADAEWLQTSGDCRAFASENEARGFLIDAEEGE